MKQNHLGVKHYKKIISHNYLLYGHSQKCPTVSVYQVVSHSQYCKHTESTLMTSLCVICGLYGGHLGL